MFATRVFDQLLRAIGLRTLNQQFLFSYALMFIFAVTASVALYLSMSVSPETINVAGAQRMLSQKMTKEALLLRQGALERKALDTTIGQFDQAHHDLLAGNRARNISVIETPAIQAQMARVGQLWGTFRPRLEQAAAGGETDLAALEAASVTLLKEMNQAVGLMAAHAESSQRRQMWLAFACVLAILVLVVLGRQFGLSPLMRDLHAVEMALTRVGGGDFTGALRGGQVDNEIGRIFAGYNRMQEQVRALLAQVKDSGECTRGHVDRAAGAAGAAGEGVRQQHEDLDQVATAMNEMSATVAEVARHAAGAADSARGADGYARSGQQVVRRSAELIEALAGQLQHSGIQVQALEAETAGVGKVLEVITGIAEQTNLLALNAAIEAARAGEAGRGFAVVADEVRTLASRTQQSTGEIQAIIQRLQEGARQAVQAMQESAGMARENQAHIGEATTVLEHIVGAVDSINAMNAQIATAAEQQSQVAAEIDQRIVHISSLAERSHGDADRVVAVSAEIQAEVRRLNEQLDRFRT
ncbi:methyl-accepting chemotaxis protein [Pseudomonas sp. CAU 1711]|uniref:methyl-accepting chemotaxis protein n=1 Tax=Pseudomonas sp. CAU 1711 TaxID=3140356 RepID=UPI00326160C2